MPEKKTTKKKAPAKEKIKETPKETPKVEERQPIETGQYVPGQEILSANQLNLKFEKVNLRDLNDIFCGSTQESFSLHGVNYSGKEYFLVMFGNGELFAVAKPFFNRIAQILPS